MSEASAGAEAESNGAEERIRTSTGLPPPAPQAGASEFRRFGDRARDY